MNWFRQNKFLGSFLAALGLTTTLSLFFLLYEKGAAEEAQARLDSTVNELIRLRQGRPFPSGENLRKSGAQADNYRSSLLALETEMKTHMFPQASFQPNEFQAQLRAATTDVEEHAHESKVKLPENFNLGFDEYATSLPNGSAAPRLGWQLRAIQWLADTIVESHVDSITSLTRARLPEEAASAAPSPTPLHRPGATPRVMTPAKKIVDANSIEIIFSGSPTAVRRAINQIATAKEQFYVIRTLVVKNQVEKGPKRAGSGEAAPTPTLTPPARGATAAIGKTTEPAISFIVGTEHLDVSARIEILKFNLPEKENR